MCVFCSAFSLFGCWPLLVYILCAWASLLLLSTWFRYYIYGYVFKYLVIENFLSFRYHEMLINILHSLLYITWRQLRLFHFIRYPLWFIFWLFYVFYKYQNLNFSDMHIISLCRTLQMSFISCLSISAITFMQHQGIHCL